MIPKNTLEAEKPAKRDTSFHRMERLVGLFWMPITIVVSVTIFAPIIILLGLLTSLGGWLNRTCDTLCDMWCNLGKEWQYLTSGAQRKQAIDAVRENKILKEQLRLLGDSEQPN
jgi:hypothetical protein